MDQNIVNKLTQILKRKKELESLSNEEIKRMYLEKGFSNITFTKEEMINVLLETSLSLEEQQIYGFYLDYIQKKDHEIISDSIDFLNNSVNEIDALLEEKGNNYRATLNQEDKKRKLEMSLRSFPLIRAKIEFSHLMRYRDDYIHERTVTGMKQAQMEDNLSDLEHGSIILREINRGNIAKLREELRRYETKRRIHLRDVYGEYQKEASLYYELLKQLFVDFLKDREIKENAILSCHTRFQLDLPCKTDNRGIKSLDDKYIREYDPELLFNLFLKFAAFDKDEDLKPETYFEKLKEFILYYVKTSISRLDVQNSKIQTRINAIYLTQKDYIDILISKKSSFASTSPNRNEEENAYVYKLQNSNN